MVLGGDGVGRRGRGVANIERDMEQLRGLFSEFRREHPTRMRIPEELRDSQHFHQNAIPM